LIEDDAQKLALSTAIKVAKKSREEDKTELSDDVNTSSDSSHGGSALDQSQ